MYKETVNKKNKTITITTDWYQHDYTQKQLVKGIKRLIKDYQNGKVQEKSDYDYDEWCNLMEFKLGLLEKLL